MTDKFPIIQLTASDKADILCMREKGSSLREIAEYIGCSICCVTYHLKKAGKCRQRKPWTEGDDEQALQMYNSGSCAAEIAAVLNRTKQSVRARIMYLRKKGHYVKYRKE